MVGEAIGYDQVGRVLLAVHSTQDPSDADWGGFSSFAVEHLPETERVFVYSAGGAPNAKQRRALSAFTAHRKNPGALVTASRVSRAVAVAVTWFHPEFRVFSPAELRAAFEFLRLRAGEVSAVLGSARELARQLNVVLPEVAVSERPAPLK